ncbi:hypothetical protein F4808DRAFT_328159 [Astrocystis sublimbata]|nr:hypothetical protein F4808DRAFT_328159 [Astrocystis sublimbata]
MASYQDGMQVADHNYPEVYAPGHEPQFVPQHHHQHVTSPIQSFAYAPTESTNKPVMTKRRRLCGASIPIILLSAVIVVLLAAVIALAVETSQQSNRAAQSETKLAALMQNISSMPTPTNPMSTSTSTSTSTPTSTPDAPVIDLGCANDKDGVTGTIYQSQIVQDYEPSYKIHCNKESNSDAFYSIFAAIFEDCIDACTLWSYWTPIAFNMTQNMNTTCAGVSYLPGWNRSVATSSNNNGNCFLKAGPRSAAALVDNDFVDFAILN